MALLIFWRVAVVGQPQCINSSNKPIPYPDPIHSPAGGVGISGGVPGSPGVAATPPLIWCGSYHHVPMFLQVQLGL